MIVLKLVIGMVGLFACYVIIYTKSKKVAIEPEPDTELYDTYAYLDEEIYR